MIKVIIIDDEHIMRVGLRETIDWKEHEMCIVGEAENGEEGIELAKKLKPEIIITDIYMPKMDGMDFIDLVRSEGLNSEIIVLSGYGEFAFAKQAIKNGVSAYLLKPVDINELVSALQMVKDKILKSRSNEDESKHLEIDVGVIRQKLIDDLFYKDKSMIDISKYNSRYFGFDIQQAYNIVMFISFKDQSDILYKQQFLNRFINDFKNDSSAKFHVSYSEHDIYYVVMFSFSEDGNCDSIVMECGNALWEKAQRENIKLTIGISGKERGISHIKNQIESAKKFVRHSESVGRGYACSAPNFERTGRAKLVQDIMDYMETNCGNNNLTVEKAARHLGISSSYLVKRLKQETEFTFNEYLTHIRIESAKSMISEQRYKVYEVAYKCGYIDVKYFTKLFKKITGYTPREYMDAYKNGKTQ